MRKHIWLVAISSIVILVVVNNAVFFGISQYLLKHDLEQRLISLGEQIRQAAEQERIGLQLFEEQLSRELRAAAISVKYALDEELDSTTSEQLQELASELDLAHITLLKRLENNDIVLYQSSDPNQVNRSIETWNPWHQQFQDFFAGNMSSESWNGLSHLNFWTGPYEASSKSKQSFYKWGYYYDDMTGYIINPYVDYSSVNRYNEATGLERLFKDLINTNDSLLEISIINPFTFQMEQATIEEDIGTTGQAIQRSVLYGSYDYQSPHDQTDVRKAFDNKEHIIRTERLEAAYTYKMFIPVFVSNEQFALFNEDGLPLEGYVLVITSNYAHLLETLNASTIKIALLTLLIMCIMVPAVIFVMKYSKHLREEALRIAQDTYVEEINALFHAIRSQRHDFINQVQTIHSLMKLKQYEELEKYTEAITGEIRLINDYMNIGHPAIAALIRSKLSQAEAYHIDFVHDVKAVKLSKLAGQALDINRILGNLIDNAFDEVLNYEACQRKVTLYGREINQSLQIIISNYCENAKQRVNHKLFESGYSTKNGDHQGLGLSIITTLVKQYKGNIQVRALDDITLSFEVIIPL